MHSYIKIVCCVVFIYSIVCFALRNPVSEPLFEDFQEQIFEEPEVFFAPILISILLYVEIS
jgi:hypothetical protein